MANKSIQELRDFVTQQMPSNSELLVKPFRTFFFYLLDRLEGIPDNQGFNVLLQKVFGTTNLDQVDIKTRYDDGTFKGNNILSYLDYVHNTLFAEGASIDIKWMMQTTFGTLDKNQIDLQAEYGVGSLLEIIRGLELTGSSLLPRGEWDPAISYNRLDLVYYQGTSYLALATTTAGTSPTSEMAKWMILAKKGDKFNFEDFTPEQLALLRFKFEDFTPEQLLTITGQSVITVKVNSEEEALTQSIANPNNIYYW